ncbi:TerC family protein [Aquirhabdus parva]|uniref:TerC family protein n=1 Tax=Aquirhabdus parva TaxID=2283318 RepID=A0A345P2D7_9GAMM|nr:TerC family protein [Aquirhabdus parva]AXI01446.1 TerC family protein [Aquirhabdus parva]
MDFFSWMSNPEAWVTLATLTVLEIVLGIDNIIFLTILVAKVPKHLQNRTRVFGLALAMITRILLLLSISWVMRLTEPLFAILDHNISGRDLILILGGLFLIYKSIVEIYEETDGEEEHNELTTSDAVQKGVFAIVIQIAIIDIVFSLDSVITAVGLSNDIPVMVLAVVASVLVMMFAAKPIGDFVERHPSIKMLALTFLVLVGGFLVIEGLGLHLEKGYLYGAMGFSLLVELLNIRRRGKTARHHRKQALGK